MNSALLRTWIIFSGIISLLFIQPVHAQVLLKGQVTDISNGSPLPFVSITINNEPLQFLSDIDGNFEICIEDTLKSVRVSHYGYRSQNIVPDSSLKDSILTIQLVRNKFFEYDNYSSDTAITIMKKVMACKKENDLSDIKHISYSTYNKATLTPDKVNETNSQLEKLFKFFSLKFNGFKSQQHFLILESATEKKIYSNHFHTEIIKGAKSTILNVPSIFIQTTQIQSFSPYENYINVGGKLYVSPLAAHTTNRYSFRLIDTIHTEQDTLFLIKFNPFPKKQFHGLKGFLYINTRNYAVQYFVASPAGENKLQMIVVQSYRYYPEKDFWFPERTKTTATVEKSGERFIATLDNYVYDLNPHSYIPKKNFDEIILEYPFYANQQDDSFWIEKRRTPLTLYDSNTYVYYDSADQKKFIQRSLKFGEHLYYGIIEYKFLDLDLKRFLDFNQAEGVRIGLGAHTNTHFSDRIILGGYFGYGFRDQRNKFGLDASYKFRKLPLSITSSYSYDLKEAGGIFFPFNRYQYSSEGLRRIRLRIMDMVSEWETGISAHPMKYLDLNSSFSISSHEPTYDYAYQHNDLEKYDFTEIRVGLRYAYGEQYIKLLQRKLPARQSHFPVFYFQFSKGFNNLTGGDFNYKRYDAKLEFTFEVLDLGTTGIQILGGVVRGDVPYMKLYNMKGSSKNPSVVIHNSFETMHYNEFLSDRFISFFLSHNFGKLYLHSKYFRPTLMLLHNFGFGSLNHPEHHQDIEFETMEKGYIESGMLLDDIVTVKITGLNVGLGAGFFYRYGPYRIDGFWNNVVAKFAVNFSL